MDNERLWAAVLIVSVIVFGALLGYGCSLQYQLQAACIENGGIWTSGTTGQCIPQR